MLAVHHLAIVVSDLVVSERFYVGVLDLSVTRRWSDERGEPRSIWLALEHGAFLALERATGGARRDDGAAGFHCVALGIAVGERLLWRDRLEEAGFPVERASPYTLYVRDPDRNLVALSHWPDAAQ